MVSLGTSNWWFGHPTRKDRVVSRGDISNGSYVYVYEHLLKSKRLEGKVKPTAQEYLDSLERQIHDVSQVCKGSGLSYNNPKEVLEADLAKRKEDLHQCLMAFQIDERDQTWNGSGSCNCHPFGYIASNILYMRKIKKEYLEYIEKQRLLDLSNQSKELESFYDFDALTENNKLPKEYQKTFSPEINADIIEEIVKVPNTENKEIPLETTAPILLILGIGLVSYYLLKSKK